MKDTLNRIMHTEHWSWIYKDSVDAKVCTVHEDTHVPIGIIMHADYDDPNTPLCESEYTLVQNYSR